MARNPDLAPVHLHFSLGPHGDFEIANMPKIKRQAEKVFKPGELNYYYVEDFNATWDDIWDMQDEYQRTGSYFRSFLSLAVDNYTPPQRGSKHVPKIEREIHRYLKRARNHKEIPESMWEDQLFGLAEVLLLDELNAQGLKVKFTSEHGSQTGMKKFEDVSMEEDYRLLSVEEAFKDGDLEKVTENTNDYLHVSADGLQIRNTKMKDNLCDLVTGSQFLDIPTNIVARLGEAHADIAFDFKALVQSGMLPQVTVTTSFDYGRLLLPHHDNLVRKLISQKWYIPGYQQLLHGGLSIMMQCFLEDQGIQAPHDVRYIDRIVRATGQAEIEDLLLKMPHSDKDEVLTRFVDSKLA